MLRPRLAVAILLMVVFLDMAGYGVLIPLVPFYVERLGAGPELITAIVASHSLAQFVMTPLWGTVSDRRGRRPVLVVSMIGHAGAYVLLAYADSLPLLLLSRLISGAASANLPAAYAYVTDITTDAQRPAALGKISAAFGLGFVLGPALGGALAGGDSLVEANLVRPALGAALFSCLALIAIVAFLPESRRPVDGASRPSGSMLGDLRRALAEITTAMILVLAVLVITFMAVRESIFALWGNHRLGLDAGELGFLFAWTGIVVVCAQFLLVAPAIRAWGELNVARLAIGLFAVSWGLLTTVNSLSGLAVALALGALGTAFFQTTLQSLLSKRARATERGAVMGIYQSSSSLARFAGQAGAGTLYGQVGVNAPFYFGVAAMLPALLLATALARRLAGEQSRV